ELNDLAHAIEVVVNAQVLLFEKAALLHASADNFALANKRTQPDVPVFEHHLKRDQQRDYGKHSQQQVLHTQSLLVQHPKDQRHANHDTDNTTTDALREKEGDDDRHPDTNDRAWIAQSGAPHDYDCQHG